MANNPKHQENLKPWIPGQSGNSKGRPKGAISLKTIIRKLHEEGQINWQLVPIKNNKEIAQQYGPNGWLAIVYVATGKAMSGDIRAMEWLRKSQYGDKLDLTSDDKPIIPLKVFDFDSPKPKPRTKPKANPKGKAANAVKGQTGRHKPKASPTTRSNKKPKV